MTQSIQQKEKLKKIKEMSHLYLSMEPLDALSVLNVLEENSQVKAGQYLVKTYLNFYWGENKKNVKRRLGDSSGSIDEALSTLIKHNCWKSAKNIV